MKQFCKKTPKNALFFARYTRKTTFQWEAQEAPIFRQEAKEAQEAPKTAYDPPEFDEAHVQDFISLMQEKSILSFLDLNNDQKITLEEVKEAHDEEMIKSWKNIDVDRNGVIDLNDFFILRQEKLGSSHSDL